MTTVSSTDVLSQTNLSGEIVEGLRTVRPSDDLPNLDFLRAVAVLLVLLSHVTYFRGITTLGPLNIYVMGGLGVRLFFVHTCFVLMLSLQRQWKNQGGLKLFESFMARRIFRIYPLSIVAVLLVLAFRLPLAEMQPWRFMGATSPSWKTIVCNILLFQPGNSGQVTWLLSPMWSLTYEMAMYLLLPFLFPLLYGNKSEWRVVMAVWAAAILVSSALLLYYKRENNLFLMFMPCFLPGVIAYQLQRMPRRKFSSFLWPGVVMGCVLFYLYNFNQGTFWGKWIKSWIVCIVLGLAIPFFAQMTARWIVVPSHLIAKYSYGIYLTHFFSIWFAFEYLRNALPLVARLAVFLVLAAGLPVFFYHLLEEPMVQVGKRIGKRFEGERVSVAAGFVRS